MFIISINFYSHQHQCRFQNLRFNQNMKTINKTTHIYTIRIQKPYSIFQFKHLITLSFVVKIIPRKNMESLFKKIFQTKLIKKSF